MAGYRPILLLILAAVAVGSWVTAVRVDVETDREGPEPVGAVTPVMSARRVPELLAAPIADRRLAAALDELLGRTPGNVCLTVAAAGQEVYARNPAAALAPGSLQKLVVATVALDLLGPDTTFRTAVLAAGPPVDGAVDGDLFLVGGGDPLLATDAYQVRFEHQPQTVTDFEALADALVAAGVSRVGGGIVGDASRYDARRDVDGWPARFIAQDQSGPLSALAVNDGWVAFPPRHDVQVPDEEPAPDPAAHAAGILQDLLVARGVVVSAAASSGGAPAGVVEVAAIQSPPMRDVVGQMLRESDNQTAELLVKELGLTAGGVGSTAAGMEVVRDHLTSLALPLEGIAPADGSGLADGNRLTCRFVQAIVDRAGPASALAAGLPVAGRTGTLTERFVDAPVAGRLRAKTGTLNQVTTLAGFVDTGPGAELTFAFLVNLTGGEVVGDDDLVLQDELAAVLVRYPEGPALADIGPRTAPDG